MPIGVLHQLHGGTTFRRFGEKLLPALEAAGVMAAEPRVFPVHNFVKD